MSLFSVNKINKLGLQFANLSNNPIKESYCFHFAWLGPFYEGEKIDCKDKKYKGVPCLSSDKSNLN